MRKLSFVKKVEVFFSHKKGKDVVQETDSDSDGDDYYGDDGEGSGGYEVTTYSASYSERVSIEENVCEADDDDDVPASPSKELGRNSSMMDISSNGSLEEMCDEDVCDVCDEDDDDCTSPIAALHSGVFGVPKSAWDIPSVIEEMQCNVLGEDSYFVHDYAVGVFDGVGGWRSNGVDPAEYSGSLARECLSVALEEDNTDPAYILECAYNRVMKEQKVIGSSTACIICLEQEEKENGESAIFLNAAYVGDSGYMIIRRDHKTGRCSVIHKSEEQQHYFNAPFQLALVHGRFAHMRDTIFNNKPAEAVLERHELQPGDIIVSGTDGMLDNLFDYEILEIVEEMYNHHPTDIARAIVAESYYRSLSLEKTPFEENARLAGQFFKGGKRDDISTVVSRVVDVSKSSR